MIVVPSADTVDRIKSSTGSVVLSCAGISQETVEETSA
jgi:hypothetical protein